MHLDASRMASFPLPLHSFTATVVKLIVWLSLMGAAEGQDILFEAGKPFKFMCSLGHAVAGITWKWIPVPNKESQEDFALSIHCQQLVSIPGRTAIFTDDSCYNAELFSITDPIEFNSPQNCRTGEFVHGIAGVYENGERRMRFTCCKASNLRLDPDFSCSKTHPLDVGTQRFGAFRNLKHERGSCPKSALTSLSISGGKAVAKFCPFTVKNYDYALYCHSDSNNGNVSRVLSARNTRQPKRLTVDTWSWIGPGVYTAPGQNFKLQCPVGEAVNGLTIDIALVPETNRTDFMYKIDCERISEYEQEAYRRRISRFQDITARVQCQGDEFLKGLWSEYRLGSRTLAYVCEEGSDITAKWRPHTSHGRLMNQVTSRSFMAKKANQFVKGFRMNFGPHMTIHIGVEFDYYYGDNNGNDKFYVSETLFEYDNAKFVAMSKQDRFNDWRRSNDYYGWTRYY